ncbi:GAF and ANTAR domain-containing protein [Kribbella sp. NPDC059898]|uniref:GAF and ANTAR domain-containing protein n=1 Tax=Kribbella sp. NPDC059898 TaxID=3346995 RepID=UPI00364F0981
MSEAEHPPCGAVSELVGRFVTDTDLVGTLGWLTDRCTELAGVSGSALSLADRQGTLDVVAASSEAAHGLQQTVEGPAQDCYATGFRIDCPDLDQADARWPGYAAAARRDGVRAVHAFPMPLLERTIGVLTLFLDTVGSLSPEALETGQLLAATAALGVESHQATQHEIRADQLQSALSSRVVIEQAKGVLAERLGLSLAESFEVLRGYARRNGRRLTDVATAVLDGSLVLPTPPR